jgi:hypothetical protein
VDAMSGCLVCSVVPDKVALCAAASQALALLAQSPDVAPMLRRSKAVDKCLALLKQVGMGVVEGRWWCLTVVRV